MNGVIELFTKCVEKIIKFVCDIFLLEFVGCHIKYNSTQFRLHGKFKKIVKIQNFDG